MGTKNNPGKFDCYANAHPDEPMFILLGRDERAPELVRMWAAFSAGDFKGAEVAFIQLREIMAARTKTTVTEKVTEANDCAAAMERWHFLLADAAECTCMRALTDGRHTYPCPLYVQR